MLRFFSGPSCAAFTPTPPRPGVSDCVSLPWPSNAPAGVDDVAIDAYTLPLLAGLNTRPNW